MSKNRIIVENRSELSDEAALLLVADIVSQGRTEVSSRNTRMYQRHSQYVKRFAFDATRNKRSDRFLVTDIGAPS